jgi:hypothetical protein
MLVLSRDLGTSYKTGFVLAHEPREAMVSEVRQRSVGGDGKKAEIDGGYFGGYVKPANCRENRKDRRKPEHRSGKRGVVVAIRERGRNGKTLPGVFHSAADALSFIRANLAPKTTLYADEAVAWNDLHARFVLHRINHQEAYSLGGPDEINTNTARSFFSRVRRGDVGHHHHVAGPYLIRFAQEAAFSETQRRDANGSQVRLCRHAGDAASALDRFRRLLTTPRDGGMGENNSRANQIAANELLKRRADTAPPCRAGCRRQRTARQAAPGWSRMKPMRG